jgi:hypothetical protein
MKAITIAQPYSHLIALGEKRVENRSWATNHRGPLAIHAGKSKSWLDSYPRIFGGMTFGGVVAVCDLVGCVRIEDVPEFAASEGDRFTWLPDHEHTHGPWCWVLDNVYRLLVPIEWKGSQGFWHFPEERLNGHDLVAAKEA